MNKYSLRYLTKNKSLISLFREENLKFYPHHTQGFFESRNGERVRVTERTSKSYHLPEEPAHFSYRFYFDNDYISLEIEGDELSDEKLRLTKSVLEQAFEMDEIVRANSNEDKYGGELGHIEIAEEGVAFLYQASKENTQWYVCFKESDGKWVYDGLDIA